MFDVLGVLVAVAPVVGAPVGHWALRQLNLAFFSETEELPAYPIVLRPYFFLVTLYAAGGCFPVLPLIAFYSSRHMSEIFPYLGPPLLLISALFFGLAFLYSRERIIIEAEKIIYRKGTGTTVISFYDFADFRVVLGYVNIDLKRGRGEKPVKVSLYFKDIRYLHAVLQTWTKNSGRKHHFTYPHAQ